MFYESNLKYINLFSFDTRNVKSMNHMFGNCNNLEQLDISFFDMENVTDTIGIFEGCSSLISSHDIFKCNKANITDSRLLFEDCSALQSLPNIFKLKKEKFINMTVIFGDIITKFMPIIPEENKSTLKIVFRGESGVGCCTLAGVITGEEFYTGPAVASWGYRKIFFWNNNKIIEAFIWNGPGQEKFRDLAKIFLRDANIIIFVYDITNRQTFEELDYHINYAKEKLKTGFIGAIVGNKKDLYMEEQVSYDEGLQFANNHNFRFNLTSAKNNSQEFINFVEELVDDYSNVKEFK